MMATENPGALADAEKHAGRIKAYVRDRNGCRFVGSVRPFDKQPPPDTTRLFRLPVELTWSFGTVVRILFVSEAHASRFPGFVPP
jgi:hypothetical protein